MSYANLVAPATSSTFHVRHPIGNDDNLKINAAMLAAEKPDIHTMKAWLEAAAEQSSHAGLLREAIEASNLFDKAAFNEEIARIRSQIDEKTWVIDPATRDGIYDSHLIAPDGITDDMALLDAFMTQVEQIRLAHLRAISKKGRTLDEVKLYPADVMHAALRSQDPATPELDLECPVTLARFHATQEVLDKVDIDTIAINLLKQNSILFSSQSAPSEVYVATPARDYSQPGAAYNFLSNRFASRLMKALNEHAQELFPGKDIQFKRQPLLVDTTLNRTDATPTQRMFERQCIFDGDIRGKCLIIADDHSNSGSIPATIHAKAKADGAIILGVATLSAHPHSYHISAPDDLIEAIKKVAEKREPGKGREMLEESLALAGLSYDTLTGREALTLLAIISDNNIGLERSACGRFDRILREGMAAIVEGIGDDICGTVLHDEAVLPSQIYDSTAKNLGARFSHQKTA